MTHDELLEEFDTWVGFLADNNKAKGWVHALRAVVELHKRNEMGYCDVCIMIYQGQPDFVIYPCPTIQAIEKELK